jgi:hypothetical protein
VPFFGRFSGGGDTTKDCWVAGFNPPVCVIFRVLAPRIQSEIIDCVVVFVVIDVVYR